MEALYTKFFIVGNKIWVQNLKTRENRYLKKRFSIGPSPWTSLKSVSRRPDGGESGMMSRHRFDFPRQREFDLGIVELLDAGATTFVGSHFLHFDDLDRRRSRSVSSAHISVALSDGAGGREVAVFAVHVVSTGTRIVTQPDSQVFHGRRLLLVDLLTGNDFTVSLLDLLQTVEVIPEARFGHHSIGCEDPHPEKRRHSQLVRGELTPDDAVFD